MLNINLTVKTTDMLLQTYWKNEFNHNYKSARIKSILENYEPNGIDIIKDGFIIIKNKRDISQLDKAKEQLKKYFEIIRKHDKKSILYGCLAFGLNSLRVKFYEAITNEQSHEQSNDIILQEISLSDIKSLTFIKNVPKKINKQQIHDLIVKTFKTQDFKEISNIFQIILMSFEFNDFIDTYESIQSLNDDLFKELLMNNVIKVLGSDFKFNSFDNVQTNELFQVSKIIYNTWKYNRSELNEIYQQFRKYQDDNALKNSVWTPRIISDLMCNLLINIYIDHFENDLIKIIDPCYGFGNLEALLIEEYPDLIDLTGLEIEQKTYRFSKLDLMMKTLMNNVKGKVINTDCFEYFNEQSQESPHEIPHEDSHEDSQKIPHERYDVCLINPPYTKKLSGHDAFDFLTLMEDSCDIIIGILPTRSIKNYKKHIKRLQINLGNKIFKGKGTGDISIIISDSFEDFEFEFKEIDCSLNDGYWIPHQNIFNITESSKKILKHIENLEFDEISDLIVNDVADENDVIDKRLISSIKKDLKEQCNKTISTIKSFILASENDKNEIIEKISSFYNRINSLNSIKEIFENIVNKNIDENNIREVKFNDVFEFIELKRITSKENVPLYTATKTNILTKYVNYYNYDIKEDETICSINTTGDGACGYCFKMNGKISVQSRKLFKPKIDNIDIDSTLILMTYMNHNVNHYNHSKCITNDYINENIIVIFY